MIKAQGVQLSRYYLFTLSLFVLVNVQETIWAAVAAVVDESQSFKEHRDKMKQTLTLVKLWRLLQDLESIYLGKILNCATRINRDNPIALAFLNDSREGVRKAFWRCPGEQQQAALKASRECLNCARYYAMTLQSALNTVRESTRCIDMFHSIREAMVVKKNPYFFDVMISENYVRLFKFKPFGVTTRGTATRTFIVV